MTKQTAFRFPDALLERLDNYAATKGINRSNALFALLEKGLSSSDSVVIQKPYTQDLEPRFQVIESRLQTIESVIQASYTSYTPTVIQSCYTPDIQASHTPVLQEPDASYITKDDGELTEEMIDELIKDLAVEEEGTQPATPQEIEETQTLLARFAEFLQTEGQFVKSDLQQYASLAHLQAWMEKELYVKIDADGNTLTATHIIPMRLAQLSQENLLQFNQTETQQYWIEQWVRDFLDGLYYQ